MPRTPNFEEKVKMMRPPSASKASKTAQARAGTAASKARNTQIQTDVAKAEARRNYRPPPSASKKEATKQVKQAQKIATIEQERG